MRNQIRVLVVDDSAFMRKLISDMLNQAPQIRVVGTARNGVEALKKQQLLNPDVMTLDVEMPVLDGLETLKKIMTDNPCPVIMLSSTTTEGAYHTVCAMEYGAVDFVTKTSGSISFDLYKVREELIEKVTWAATAKIAAYRRKPVRTIASPQRKNDETEKTVIAIGTSTGGPKALKEVLTKLPPDLSAPIVIVQHMPQGFTKSLADRLNKLSQIAVEEARNGQLIKKGVAYIAPGGHHVKLRQTGQALALETVQEPPRRGHRPSVDVLFESIAKVNHVRTIAVVMTGMGSDGTAGLKELAAKGSCLTIAESERTAVIYGMPKSAIQANLVDEIVDLGQIAARIVSNI